MTKDRIARDKEEFIMSDTLKKMPREKYWITKSLSFTAEEITGIQLGEIKKIMVMTPDMKCLCTITEFKNILSSIQCKGDYYVARYKKEDTNYKDD